MFNLNPETPLLSAKKKIKYLGRFQIFQFWRHFRLWRQI